MKIADQKWFAVFIIRDINKNNNNIININNKLL